MSPRLCALFRGRAILILIFRQCFVAWDDSNFSSSDVDVKDPVQFVEGTAKVI